MKDVLIAAMPGEEAPAARLAALTGATAAAISVKTFPDGESLVTAPRTEKHTAIYCSLDHPDEKLFPLLLAASALRGQGAERLALIAPYLAYMRQDRAFNDGEAVSQKVFAKLLSDSFDKTLTLEPHLHRTARLDEVFGVGRARAVSAAPLLGEMIVKRLGPERDNLMIAGPDEESAPWTKAVAGEVGAPWLVMHKQRKGGRDVEIGLAKDEDVSGKTVCIVDDIASTGGTLATAARLLKDRGANNVSAFVVHVLLHKEDLTRVKQAGVDAVYSTDAIRHETNAIEIAPLLARALNAMVSP